MVVRLAAIISMLVLAASASAQPPKKPWTILLYGAADNNADGPILQFLDGVRKAIDDDPGLDVLLFIDRHEKYSKDARILGGNFTGARLFRLHKASAERLGGGEFFPEITLGTDAELDSADAATLGRFIAWGKAQSPAERYALLIYSHANGRTMCPDEQSGNDMGIAELTDEIGPEGRVDFLALELCNMGGIEIAHQWRPDGGRFAADVLLAIPNAGPPLDWHLAFERIRSKGHVCAARRPPLDPATMTAADFGRLVIEEGYEGRQQAAISGRPVAHEAAASYDLRAAGAVKESVDALARELAKSDGKAAIGALRAGDKAAMNYTEGGPYVDLYDLCEKAAGSEGVNPAARAAARLVMERVDTFVLDSFGMDAYADFKPGKNGVFVVLPAGAPGGWQNFAWYTPAAGTGKDRYGRWAFLRDGATPGNGVVENWFELLDSWFDEGDVNGYKP